MALVRTRKGTGESPRGDAAPAKPVPREPEAEEKKPGQRYKVAVDVVNEAIVVAALIAVWSDEDRRKELLRIRPDDFATELYAAIWRALEELARKRLEYDPRTLVDLGGGAFRIVDLAELLEVHPEPPPALEHHIERIRWNAAKVRAVKGPLTALLESFEVVSTPPEKMKLLAHELYQTLETSSRGLLRDDREVAELTVQRARQRHDGVALYPYGLEGLDYYEDGEPRMVPGAAPGQMTLIVGLPGSGKSALAKGISLAQAEIGRRVLYCAWEMGFERDLETMAAARLKIDVGRLRTGRLEKEELARLEQEIWLLSKIIKFTDRPFANERRKWSNEEALDLLGEAIAQAAADVVIVDLWKMLLRYARPEDEESALTLQQKILQETKCHGILLHQLNAKDVERRVDTRPTRDALKGSTIYLERPDTILGVHRPGAQGKVPDTKAEVLVMKQRDYQAHVAVEFDWSGPYQSFRSGRTIPYPEPGADSDVDGAVKGILDKKFADRAGGKKSGGRFGKR